MRPVPDLELQFCIISRHRALEVITTAISMGFGTFQGYSRLQATEPARVSYADTTVFGLTVYFSWRLGATRPSLTGSPSLLHILVRDGAIYFLFILANHMVLTFALLFGRVSRPLLATGVWC